MSFKEWTTGQDSESNPVKSIFNTDQIVKVEHGNDNSTCRLWMVGYTNFQTITETYSAVKSALSAS